MDKLLKLARPAVSHPILSPDTAADVTAAVTSYKCVGQAGGEHGSRQNKGSLTRYHPYHLRDFFPWPRRNRRTITNKTQN
jgi:hypothetical protein